MKHIKLSFVTFILTFGVFLLVQAQDPFTNGLVAYYPFNGNANDASGNGNNGTVTAAALAVDRLGNQDSAYVFDGVSSLITVPDSPSLRITNDITISCWVTFAQSNGNVRVVGKGADCGRSYGLWGHHGQPGNFWMFQQFPPEGGCIGCQENTASALPVVQFGRWYHMVAVRSTNGSKLYIDAQLTEDNDGPTINCSPTTYTGNEPLLIGAPGYANPQHNLALMNGSIDDIRIYNRAFSPTEVLQLYLIESGLHINLIKAVKPTFSGLTLGTNYQLQISGNLSAWTNEGSMFTATNTSMVYPQYWDVDNWGSLFFRLQVSP